MVPMVPLYLRRWRKQSAWGIAQFRGFQLYGSASSSLHRHGSLRIPLFQTHLFFTCFMFFPQSGWVSEGGFRDFHDTGPRCLFSLVGQILIRPAFGKLCGLVKEFQLVGGGMTETLQRWDKDCLIMFNPHPWSWISMTRDYMDCLFIMIDGPWLQ